MATTCRSSEGDRLDSICFSYYGYLDGCVEAVLDANPGLADEAQPLRAGLLITLPDLAAPTDGAVRLWD
ncbi:MAG: hypothetical protein GAK44_00161 [Pseudomonas delhiensis]|nr:MAG: hypothetical protein GAK44_00161 [Pseudomonas delhiensis]